MRLPRRLRRPVEAMRTLWAVGAFQKPLELYRQWRHRDAFRRLQKSLFFHRYASAILLAHEVGLFDSLSARPRTVEEAAAACAIKPNAAAALLRVLESERLLVLDGGRARLSEFGELFLSRAGQFSMASMLDLLAAQAAAFAELPAAMATGRVPTALDIFAESSRYRSFLDGVNDYLSLAGRDLVRRVELPEVRSFIVGSMGVSMSAILLARLPGSRVTYGCLPHLTREIPRLREKYRVDPARVAGTHAHGGDPEADRWGDEAFDLVFLTKKMILAPEDRIGEKFARKAWKVLRPGGVAIFWETVHTDGAPTPLPRAMEAVLDLGASPAGPVSTESDLRRLLGGIGFRAVEVVPCLGDQTTFVVARR